jgi:3-dehydroquinate dehydratase II
VKILILNGPNLNLLGKREPGIYGYDSFESFLEQAKKEFSGHTIDYYQSNVEGELINELHRADGKYDGILLNAGGYTHTSVALADAVSAIKTPVVEVHISNILSREEYRHTSLIGGKCKGSISGFGLESYSLALLSFLRTQK